MQTDEQNSDPEGAPSPAKESRQFLGSAGPLRMVRFVFHCGKVTLALNGAGGGQGRGVGQTEGSFFPLAHLSNVHSVLLGTVQSESPGKV